MKFYSQKIAAIGLIVVLVSLAGWFCVNPQGMQMTGDSSGVHIKEIGGVLHSALNTCAVNDCLSKLPQVVVAKKFSVDFGVGFLASVIAITRPPASLRELAFASEALRAGPPVPDILSSVFKKE